MKVFVDKEKCIGCGACVAVCPDVFELKDDGKSHVISSEACEKTCDCEEAASICPVEAIKVTK
jgi:ferredoxin